MANPVILQACMELIYKQEYISWRLPKNSTVLLSTNPSDGSYSVSEMDEAQATRFVTLNVKFDAVAWSEWAEANHLDGRTINFLLAYHNELMDRSKTKVAKVNARNYTMFANIIAGIPDWSTPENLAFILQIASGCFPGDNDVVGSLFTTFIANKLDRLIAPEDLVMKDWAHVKKELEDQLYDGKQYRADIGSVITTRFINFTLNYLAKPDSKVDIIINRILDIIDNPTVLLTEDLLFTLVKTINVRFPGRCNKLLLNPKLAKKLI